MNFKFVRKLFSTKIKSKVKPIAKDVKPVETFDDIPVRHKQDYYDEIKYSILVLDTPVRIRYWLLAHSLPVLTTLQDPLNILWLYQTFWASTAIGLASHSFEFYASVKERSVLKRFILLGYIFEIR
jgi:hypothetical protein